MFLLAVAYAMKFAGIEPVMTSRHEKRTIIVGIPGLLGPKKHSVIYLGKG